MQAESVRTRQTAGQRAQQWRACDMRACSPLSACNGQSRAARGIRWRHCRHCAAAPQCFAHSAWSVLRHGIDVLMPSERVCHFGGDRRPPLTHVAAGGASGRTALRGGTRRCEGHRARLSVAMRWGVVSIRRRAAAGGPSSRLSVGARSAANSACVRGPAGEREAHGGFAQGARRGQSAQRAEAQPAGAALMPSVAPGRGAGAGHRAMRCLRILVGIPSRRCTLHVCRAVPCRAGCSAVVLRAVQGSCTPWVAKACACGPHAECLHDKLQ